MLYIHVNPSWWTWGRFGFHHIWEVLSHLRECRSLAAFPGGSQMIREGSHVWLYLHRTSFGQVPVLVVCVKNAICIKTQAWIPIFRLARPFWSTHATNIWKKVIRFLLMAQFHYNGNMASGRQAYALGTHNLADNNRKRNSDKTEPVRMQKRIGYKIFTIFYTPGSYAEGYIVFISLFVRSYVCSFIQSWFHPIRELLQFYIKSFSGGVYLTNHSSESIHIWTIGTLEGWLLFHGPGWG